MSEKSSKRKSKPPKRSAARVGAKVLVDGLLAEILDVWIDTYGWTGGDFLYCKLLEGYRKGFKVVVRPEEAVPQ